MGADEFDDRFHDEFAGSDLEEFKDDDILNFDEDIFGDDSTNDDEDLDLFLSDDKEEVKVHSFDDIRDQLKGDKNFEDDLDDKDFDDKNFDDDLDDEDFDVNKIIKKKVQS